MLEVNRAMKEFLNRAGISCNVKYIATGSMKGTYRIYKPKTRWTDELMDKFNALGFVDFNHRPLCKYSGNGGDFMVWVRYLGRI